MMHKAWYSIEEVPYCYSRSFINFQGHTGWLIEDLKICNATWAIKWRMITYKSQNVIITYFTKCHDVSKDWIYLCQYDWYFYIYYFWYDIFYVDMSLIDTLVHALSFSCVFVRVSGPLDSACKRIDGVMAGKLHMGWLRGVFSLLLVGPYVGCLLWVFASLHLGVCFGWV